MLDSAVAFYQQPYKMEAAPFLMLRGKYLDDNGMYRKAVADYNEYEKLMAGENAELAKKYGVKQAPTLIVPDGEGFEKIAGAGAIKQFLADRHIA